MRRSLVGAACLALALPLAGGAQQTFRSGVDLVRVDALVTDGHKPMAGLTAADFELRDNGVTQALDAAQIESLPLSVIFVLDVSGSVSGQKMRNFNAAVDLVLSDLRDEDRAALVTFSQRVWVRTPLSSDFARLRAVLSSTEAGGGTALHDAVYAGLALSDVLDARPLLVVCTDGFDNSSWLTADVVRSAARRANAVIYGVAVAAATMRVNRVNADRSTFTTELPYYAKGQMDFLDAVADATGGRVLKADTLDKLPPVFDEILREFRTRYVLTYSPRGVDTPGWHRIELRVKGRRADVKARPGYQK